MYLINFRFQTINLNNPKPYEQTKCSNKKNRPTHDRKSQAGLKFTYSITSNGFVLFD